VSRAATAEFQGQVVAVSGASRGIGRAVAVEFARRGADVALIQRGPATETADAVTALGRRAVAVAVDLGETGQAERSVDTVVDTMGRLDVLVCNAAEVMRADALTVGADDWRRMIEVDLVAPFIMSRAAAVHFERQGSSGRIVFIASVLGFQGGIRVSAYAAAKAAIVNLTRALANEWAPLGIRVNAVAPGYIETEQTAPLRADAERKAQLDARIPAGRWGAPEDVANAVAFLASDHADYIHGHTLVVDGGWLAR